jgi:hypothetical protein
VLMSYRMCLTLLTSFWDEVNSVNLLEVNIVNLKKYTPLPLFVAKTTRGVFWGRRLGGRGRNGHGGGVNVEIAKQGLGSGKRLI